MAVAYFITIVSEALILNIKFFNIFVILSFLFGCAETQLIVHTAKKLNENIDKKQPQQRGYYKIGNPYQIKGIWYYPNVNYEYDETGVASWYGPGFNGKLTANGEIYDQNALTAAHKTLPMPSIVQVTNLENGRSLKVTVNDRGPYAFGRIIDMSRRGAQLLGFHRNGTAKVRVKILSEESRILAESMKSSATLARIGTPISKNIDVSKDKVSAQNLGPPNGGEVAAPRPLNKTQQKFQRIEVRNKKKIKENRDALVKSVPIKATNVYVQAGAFTRFDFANRTAAKLSELGSIKISSFKRKGIEFFRVRAGPISSINNADKILERIIRAGFLNARIVID